MSPKKNHCVGPHADITNSLILTLFAPFSLTMVSNPLLLPLISLYVTFLDSSTRRDEISKVFHVKALIAPRIWVEKNKKKKIPGRNIFAVEGPLAAVPSAFYRAAKSRPAIPRIPRNSVLCSRIVERRCVLPVAGHLRTLQFVQRLDLSTGIIIKSAF